MIRAACVADEPVLLQIVRRVPCLGVRIEMDWRLLQLNRRLPYQFYMVGQTAVLEQSGNAAVLCGTPENPPELELFLQRTGIGRLTSGQWTPEGWRCTSHILMQWGGPQQEKPAPCMLPPPGLETAPGISEVLAVLESSDGRIVPQTARDGFAGDLAVRRNHGFALVCGVRKQGRLVSTAGIYAKTGEEAYIACVETVPEARGNGYATALVRYLCVQGAEKKTTLMCRPELESFYKKLNFYTLGSHGFQCVK